MTNTVFFFVQTMANQNLDVFSRTESKAFALNNSS